MKKFIFSISLIFGFLIAFGEGSGRHSHFKSASDPDCSSSLVHSTNYPDTELEITHRVLSSNNTGRQQSHQNFIGTAEPVRYHRSAKGKKGSEHICLLSCKQYLFFIYPSHNFW